MPPAPASYAGAGSEPDRAGRSLPAIRAKISPPVQIRRRLFPNFRRGRKVCREKDAPGQFERRSRSSEADVFEYLPACLTEFLRAYRRAENEESRFFHPGEARA